LRHNTVYGLTIALIAGAMMFPALGTCQTQSDAANEVKALPQKLVATDNSDASGLLIQSATAREITKAQFEHLTGAKASGDSYISCPRITIVNNTGRPITEFSVMTFNRVSKVIEDDTTRVDLQPGQEYEIKPLIQATRREALARRGTYAVDPNDGKVRPQTVKAVGWDSQGAWMPGAIGDFSVLVAEIKFADGASWKISR
jgi:hypothetical protein